MLLSASTFIIFGYDLYFGLTRLLILAKDLPQQYLICHHFFLFLGIDTESECEEHDEIKGHNADHDGNDQCHGVLVGLVRVLEEGVTASKAILVLIIFRSSNAYDVKGGGCCVEAARFGHFVLFGVRERRVERLISPVAITVDAAALELFKQGCVNRETK